MGNVEDINAGQQSVAFNMSMQLVQHIFGLLQSADSYRESGRISSEFEALRRIKFNFIQSLTALERKVLSIKEKELSVYLIAHNVWEHTEAFTCEFEGERELTSIQKQVILKLYRSHKLPILIDEYRTLIMDLLESKGYLVKKLSDLKVMF